jgi:SAM-dependent methyltransferase
MLLQQRFPAPVTHVHLAVIIRTMLTKGSLHPRDRALRILDVGCGDGTLVEYLQKTLSVEHPDLTIEVFGFDVTDQGHNDPSQSSQALVFLTKRLPKIYWKERIKTISADDDWPYKAGWFDVAVSNQVLEHVDGVRHFLRNLKRVVRTNGLTVHLLPLANCIMEGHIKVPFAHWIRSFDQRVAYIAALSHLGIGRYEFDKQALGLSDRQQYAEESAKFIQCWTSYRTFPEIYEACSGLALSVSYAFTPNFFSTKLRQLLRLPPPRMYSTRFLVPGWGWLSFTVLKYISSVTLIIRPIHHDVGERIRAEKAVRLKSLT